MKDLLKFTKFLYGSRKIALILPLLFISFFSFAQLDPPSVNSDPTDILLNNNSIAENLASNVVVGQFSTEDPDFVNTHTYTLVPGVGDDNNNNFNISGNELRTSKSFDFEAFNTFSIRIQTEDDYGGTFQKQFIINVLNAPELVTLSPENGTSAVSLAQVFTITFDTNVKKGTGAIRIHRPDNSIINITEPNFSGNQLEFNVPELLYNTTYTITVNNTFVLEQDNDLPFEDLSDKSSGWDFTTVKKNATPTDIILSSKSIEENNAINAVIGTFTTTDADTDDTHQYSLVNGPGDADNGSFNIMDAQLRAGESFDFESKDSYSIRVQTDDGKGGTFARLFTISIIDVDDTAPILQSTVPSNNSTNIPISSNLVMNFSEPVDHATSGNAELLIKETSDGAIFESIPLFQDDSRIIFNGTQVTINPAGDFVYSTDYYIQISANGIIDGAGNPFAGISGTDTWSFTTVAKPNTTPTGITLSSKSIEENNAINAVIGTFTTTDADTDDTHQYSLVNGPGDADNGSFNIMDAQLRAGESFDFESKDSYSIRVQTDDGKGGSYAENFVIKIIDLDENAPVIISKDPAAGSENVSINKSFSLIFDEKIKEPEVNQGNIRIHNLSGNIVEEISFSPQSISNGDLILNNNEVSFFRSPLEFGEEYYITIEDNAIQDTNHNGFTGVSTDKTWWNFSTEKQSQTLTFTAIPNKETTDPPFQVFATASSGLPITFSILAGPASISGNIITLTGATGVVEVQAQQLGNEKYKTTSAITTFTVTAPEKQEQTITFEPLQDKTYGDAPFELEATASSGLDVKYIILDGPASLNGSLLTINGAGEIKVKAVQEGNNSFNPASPVERNFTAQKADLRVVADDKSIVYGQQIPQLTLSYAGFVKSDDKTVLTEEPDIFTAADGLSDAGEYPIALSGGEDENYTFLLKNGTLEIKKAPQQISVEPISDKSITDPPFTINASVSSGLELFYELLSGPATIKGNQVTLNGTQGIVQIRISQAGNINFQPVVKDVSFQVTESRLSQSISFSAIASQIYGNPDFKLEATSSADLPVIFQVISGPAELNQDIISITGAGEVIVEASQPGNDEYLPAEPVQKSFSVAKAELKVKARDLSIMYGEKIPEPVIVYDGFVNDDEEQDLNDLPLANINADNSSNAGFYSITVAGGSDDNYFFTYLEGNFSISKADQVIVIEAITDKFVDDEDFPVIANVDSDLPLKYEVISGPATVIDNIISLTRTEGEVILEVSQSGNINYNPATEQVSFNVLSSDKTRPSVTIHSNEADTVRESFIISIIFSERIKGFNLEDIDIQNGSIESLITSDHINFTAVVKPINIDYIIINIPENIATDMSENGNKASEDFEIYFAGTITSLVEKNVSEFEFYPNPVKDFLVVINPLSQANIKIINMQGVAIHNTAIRQGTSKIALNFIKPGVYIIEFFTPGNQYFRHRLLVE